MPSKYQPQLQSWREDLYKGIYSANLRLRNNKKLCYQNDNYCELSRRIGGMGFFSRWFIIMLTFSCVLVSLGGAIFCSIAIIWLGKDIPMFYMLGPLFLLLSGYIFLQLTLHHFYAPEDCPIRLNRKTGKVYIYEHFVLYAGSWAFFKRSPFKAKEIVVKEFDWSDIQAVMTSVSMPLSSGGMVRNYRIECIVCKPNTTEMIDHFLLSTDSSLCYDEWMWINSYMAFSDRNLDKTLTQPESFWARKVKWPEGIDKASKARSKEELAQIEQEYQLTEKVYSVY